jgi:hypothetical protein
LQQRKKTEAVKQILGEDAVLVMDNADVDAAFEHGQKEMIKQAGGKEAWDLLSPDQRRNLSAGMIKQVLISLGGSEYSDLTEEQRRELDFFVWVGCGCHKNTNTVLGGHVAVMKWWGENNLPGPVLLANKDNTAVLCTLDPDSEPTAAHEHALQSSTRGGIKATDIAGAIFRNKDHKKGQQDVTVLWFEFFGDSFTFPSTSNNRYGSHCAAAACLLMHLDKFIEFLEFIRDKKKNRTFNNMESNLYKALKCNSTLTELAVMALYAQAISHPYIWYIRAPGRDLNMLDLGPLHNEVLIHMQKIINTSDLLVGSRVSHTTGELHGRQWETPELFPTVKAMADRMPHLKQLVVVFFNGAKETWKRFTSEFTPGGIIDEATLEEKELAWMPPTNDLNEGLLGSYRQFMRFKPLASLLQFNANAMYQRNDTQAWVDRNFLEEDHRDLMRMQREQEASGEEKKKQQELIEFETQRVARRKEAAEKSKQQRAEKNARLAQVPLILDAEVAGKLKGNQLKEQLDAFKLAGAPFPIGVSKFNADQKRELLKSLVESLDKPEG